MRPQHPIFPQALRAQHQHILVELLIVLDNGERLEGLPKADTVGDDTAVILLQLTNRADNGVLLKIVELAPNHRLEKTRVFTRIMVQSILKEMPEDVVESQEIDEFRGIVRVKCLHLRSDLFSHVAGHRIVRPHVLKMFHEECDLFTGLIPRAMADHRECLRTALNS